MKLYRKGVYRRRKVSSKLQECFAAAVAAAAAAVSLLEFLAVVFWR